MLRRAVILAAALAAGACASPGTAAAAQAGAQQAGHDDALLAAAAQDEEFRKRQFVEAGLPSIDQLAADGREIRRLWLRGFYPVALPILQIERRGDGSVSLSIYRDGGIVKQLDVSSAAWAEVTALDEGVFQPAAPAPPGAPGATACHGDSAYFEAADHGVARSAGGMDCPGALSPHTAARRSSVELFTRLALSALDCRREPDTTSGWALARCVTGRDGRPQ